jgi:hypothetical protein
LILIFFFAQIQNRVCPGFGFFFSLSSFFGWGTSVVLSDNGEGMAKRKQQTCLLQPNQGVEQ